MGRRYVVASTLLILMAFAVGCNSDNFLFPTMRKDISDLELKTVADGHVFLPGDGLPVQISTSDTATAKPFDLHVAIFAPAGTKAWETRLTPTVVNEPLPAIQLPDLPNGQYRLDLTLGAAGNDSVKKSVVIFSSKQPLRINGIKSYPAGITVLSPVLLKAELEIPAGADPYMRWTWRGKTIADGLAAKGFKSIIWSVPEDEGVYTITLEIFPTVPVEVADTPFKSSLSLSTDIYVSAGKTVLPLEFGPEASYYALYHFRANLLETGAAEKKTIKTDALPIGNPEVVPTDYGFGYHLADGAGLRIPWAVLPPGAGIKKPFTVSLSARLENPDARMSLLQIRKADGNVMFAIEVPEEALSPELVIPVPGGQDIRVASDAVMEKGRRHLLSVSIVPLPAGFSVQWFLDGAQTAATMISQPLPSLGTDGEALIGGEGFVGTVDEFGVYVKDEKGKDSPDPALYAREAARLHGDALLMAEGFDGISLPAGFAVKGAGTPAAPVLGSLSIAPGAGLELPTLKAESLGMDMSIALAQSSAEEAILGFAYKGDEKTAEARIPARSGKISFSLKNGVISFGVAETARTLSLPAARKDAEIILTLSNPKDAKAPVIVASILAIKQKD